MDPSRLSRDTSHDAEQVQLELWRAMSPARKLDLACTASHAARELSLAGIRHRHPDASEAECRLRLAVLVLGADTARSVYPEVARLLEPDP